jgi:hypothetical protein
VLKLVKAEQHLFHIVQVEVMLLLEKVLLLVSQLLVVMLQ